MGSRIGTIPLDLNALRCFVAAVEAGGVTAGARRLGLAKSTLSRQLTELEARVGERLFERHGRGTSPTGAGRRLHDAAREAIAALERLEEGLRNEPLTGQVRVAAPLLLGRGPLRQAVTEFLARHAGIDVAVELSDRFTAAQSSAADIVFGVGTAGSAPADALPLGMVESRLYAAPGLLAGRPPAEPLDLARLPILAAGCAPAERTAWTLTDAEGHSTRVGFRPRLIATDPDLLLAAAIAGQGVCRLPGFIAAPWLRAGSLAPVLPGYVTERFHVALVVQRRGTDPAVRRFADAVGARMAELLRTP